MFGYISLEDLPELPRYKLDENKQIVIDDLIEESGGKAEKQDKNADKYSEEKSEGEQRKEIK